MQSKEETENKIAAILNDELPICIRNFVANDCKFAGFSIGDIFINNMDGPLSMDNLSLFLLDSKSTAVLREALIKAAEEKS